MEKTSNDFVNLFSILPPEIQQHIATYLDAPTLGFFAQSSKQTLRNVLPLLLKFKAMFPLQLTSAHSSTYLYQANQLFVCGYNADGQLGLEDKAHRFTFTAVPWPEYRGSIQQVVTGFNYTVVLTQANQLWVCGDNEYAQLGLGNKVNYSTFTAVPWPKERGQIQQVIAGGNHTLVLTDTNCLWVCGNNQYGQLGLGNKVNHSTFTVVPWPEDRSRIQQVIAGDSYTVVLTQDNRLWGCGNNNWVQLGLGYKQDSLTFTPVPWPADRGRIQQLNRGKYHIIVLTEDNRLWVCGDNGFGQLGLRDTEHRSTFTAVPWPKNHDKIRQVITDWNHTVVLTQDNRLWVCGYNEYGQLGLRDTEHRSTFTAVPWPKNRGKIRQVITGGYHTVVLTENNRLWVCGDHEYGQLGLEDTAAWSFTFIPVTALSQAMQQVFAFNHTLNQLITLSTTLTSTPSAQSNTLLTQYQPDESDGQLLLKK